MTDAPGPADGATPPSSERASARVRRSPRISNFVLAGVILGAIVALVLTFAFPEVERFSQVQIFGFLLLITGTLFGAIGAVVALVMERTSRKRARQVEVEIERGVDDGD